MKKINIFLLLLLPLIVIVLSIIIMNNSYGGQNYINAIVLEVKENSVVVEILDLGDVNNDSQIACKEHVIVNSGTVNKSASPNLCNGDIVRIVYNSDNIKKEPLTIETVYAIYLLDELEL